VSKKLILLRVSNVFIDLFSPSFSLLVTFNKMNLEEIGRIYLAAKAMTLFLDTGCGRASTIVLFVFESASKPTNENKSGFPARK
jgi:hypothetical protein